jgi:hypothetical protein
MTFGINRVSVTFPGACAKKGNKSYTDPVYGLLNGKQNPPRRAALDDHARFYLSGKVR